PDSAAHSGIPCTNMILTQPWAINPVMPRGGTEVPNPRLAVAGDQAIPDQLVSCPLVNDGAGDITNIVLIEAQHRSKAGFGQRLARACNPIAMQALEVDSLFKVHLRRARRLQRPIPAM